MLPFYHVSISRFVFRIHKSGFVDFAFYPLTPPFVLLLGFLIFVSGMLTLTLPYGG
jgi:hypothetical protein